LSFLWTVAAATTSYTLSLPDALPISGNYTATLVVSDGVATSPPSATTVTIVSPVITVTTPNTNVNWGVGSTQTIAWTHNLGAGRTVDLDVRSAGTGTWSLVAAAIANA